MNEHRLSNGIGIFGSCIILLLLIMALIPPATAAADTMFCSDPHHTDVFDNGGIVPTSTELWRFDTGDSVWSSPAVSSGIVYVGSWDHNLYAIDAVTGKEKWQFKTGDNVYSSPAISSGVVYVGSNDGNQYAVRGASSSQSAP